MKLIPNSTLTLSLPPPPARAERSGPARLADRLAVLHHDPSADDRRRGHPLERPALVDAHLAETMIEAIVDTYLALGIDQHDVGIGAGIPVPRRCPILGFSVRSVHSEKRNGTLRNCV